MVWGETAGVKGQLWVLYPLLFILQVGPGLCDIKLRLCFPMNLNEPEIFWKLKFGFGFHYLFLVI